MSYTIKSDGRFVVMAVLALLFLAACDSGQLLEETEPLDDDTAQMADALVQDLALSTQEATALRTSMASHEGLRGEPGFLWRVAADLQASLTAEQKERLFARAEQMQQRDHRPRHQRRQALRFLLGDHLHGDGPLADVFATLTDEQRQALETIRESYRPQLRDLMAQRRDGALDAADFREQMQALREAMRAEIEAVLTDEQKAALEAAREQMKADREERRAAVAAVRDEVLGLTDEQKTALEELHAEHRAELQSLREQLEAGTAEPDELREAFEALREAHTEALAAVLTAEQLEIVTIHRILQHHVGKRMLKRRLGQRGDGAGFGD